MIRPRAWSAEPKRGLDRLLATGLAAAYSGLGLTFRGPRERFWPRMTTTGLALGGLSLATVSARGRPRVKGRDLAVGVVSAAGLYALFQVGDRLARRMMPGAGRDIESIYRLGELGSKPRLAARLALVIGPAEELFWRGFVQRRLEERLGARRAAALASAAYGGAHLASGNLTLVGAATTAGVYWSALAAAGVSMPALIVSHVVWDIWIFLIAPTRKGPAGESKRTLQG